MNFVTATLIVILMGMFFTFLVRIHSINKGKPMPKSLSSELINIFSIIPRGLAREMRKVLNSDLKSEDRLKGLINLIIVTLFLIAAIVGSMVLLVYTPFGGGICVCCALILCVLGLIIALYAADISIHKVF
jgi:hypothetical protein